MDKGKLKFNPAVELSYLTPEEQTDFFEYIDSMDCTPSFSQAQRLKTASRNGALDPEKLSEIMCLQSSGTRPKERQFFIDRARVERFFPQHYSNEQMAEEILRLLERRWHKRQAEQER